MLALATFVKSSTPSRSFGEVVATVTALFASGILPPKYTIAEWTQFIWRCQNPTPYFNSDFPKVLFWASRLLVRNHSLPVTRRIRTQGCVESMQGVRQPQQDCAIVNQALLSLSREPAS